MQATYEIPVQNVAKLSNELSKLAKKAAKLGGAPITFSFGDKPFVKQVRRIDAKGGSIMVDEQVVTLTVEGEAPGLNGWKVIGDLDWTDGITTRRMFDFGGREMPAHAANCPAGTCEHCGLVRTRLSGWVVEHADGTVKVVGSSCLSDFTGHPSPAGLAASAELLFDLRSLCEEYEGDGGAFRRLGWNAFDFAYAAVVAARYQGGYVKRNDDGVLSTAMLAEMVADARIGIAKSESIGYDALEKAGGVEAAAMTWEALRWLSEQASASDWLYNLRAIYASGWVSTKRASIAASLVAGFFREVERRAEQATPSFYVGKVKERRAFGKARVVSVYESAGDYGTTWFVTLRIEEGPEAGAVLVWTSSRYFEPTKGDLVCVEKATVKTHKEWKGVPRTVITRAVVTPVSEG